MPSSSTRSEPARPVGTSLAIAGAAWRLALGIAALYAVFGIAWIVFSDAWVASLSSDLRWLELAQRTKGLLYVALTALALALLVRAGYGRLLRAAAQTQQRLERQQQQFRQLHQSLAEVLWLASADGRTLLYLSPAFEALCGLPAREFERNGARWLDLVHPEDRERAARCHASVLERGECVCDYRICRPDGSVRWVAERRKAIADERGEVALIGGIVEDVTEHKERDAQLERMVADRTDALARTNAELEAFSRTVAHDLKSPLGAIVGCCQLLQMRHGSEVGDDGRQMLGRITQSAWHMTSLVNDLLALSVVAHAGLRLGAVDLAPLARELVDELRRREPQRRVAFEAPAELMACCDSGLARSLLANALGNAWKFSARRDDARIRLSSAAVGTGTLVRIEDNGAGFDPGDGSELFKPFRRFHGADEFSGTGIGLATCARIVERHGGRISIESTPGQGTTLSILLPDAGCAPLPAAAARPGAAAGAGAAAAGSGAAAAAGSVGAGPA